MFTVTYGEIRSPRFTAALNRVMGIRALPVKTSSNLIRIFKALAEEERSIKRQYDALVDDFIEKDAEGKPVQAEGQMPGTFKIVQGKAEELDAKLREFHALTVEIHRSRLDLEYVARELTPDEIMALESLWEPVEDVQGAHLKRV